MPELLYCFFRTEAWNGPTIPLFHETKKQRPNFRLHPYPNYRLRPRPLLSVAIRSQGVGFEDIAAIAQNKVLVAATLSAAIGQLTKPITSTLFYGNVFDFKATVQAGGFPSTHSSAAVATAMSLGLERGFSDSIFGLTVVYAALIMYDAQGVRRAVGTHAKTINRMLHENHITTVSTKDGERAINSGAESSPRDVESLRILFPGESDTLSLRESSLLDRTLDSNGRDRKSKPQLTVRKVETELKKGSVKELKSYYPLSEEVGHTEVEVIAGAMLGLFVSLTVYAVL